MSTNSEDIFDAINAARSEILQRLDEVEELHRDIQSDINNILTYLMLKQLTKKEKENVV